MSKSSIVRGLGISVAWLLCQGFTGGHVAWAEDAQFTPQTDQPRDSENAQLAHPDLYIEDPYAPHDTTGSEARLGTIVGFVYAGTPQDIVALGLSAAGGYRFGRLTIESELDAYELRTQGQVLTPLGLGEGDINIGHGERLSAMARLDVIRLDSHVVGQNSMLAVYVEAGAGVEWNSWSQPGSDQPSRVVPDDTKRAIGQFGFGIALDHRLQEPIGFPHRIAWLLGWRMAVSPHAAMTGTECRGLSCQVVTMEDDSSSYVDRSTLFQSSLAFTF